VSGFYAQQGATSKLVDVIMRRKETQLAQVFVGVVAMAAFIVSAGVSAGAQAAAAVAGVAAGPPPSSVGFFPLSQVKRGMKATAWTVFEGTAPEPMDVEILGILRGSRGPGRDLILARLHGEKPEYTGVVAGMSGSPVYLDGKLLGALSYRIGQFSKEPIAGITPIEQMLEVRDLPLEGSANPRVLADARTDSRHTDSAGTGDAQGMTFAAMETPLLMSGFQPAAVALWKERMAGTGLDVVSAGGGSSVGAGDAVDSSPVVPGSAVSLQMVRGDMEIAATCTVTYIDPKQLLACGHPVLQAGPVSLPMTATEVVATLASPLNAFKIVNTGREIGAFTEDRDAAIRGELGAKAVMIPVSVTLTGEGKPVERKFEVLDMAAMTPSALLVSIYQTLLESNQGTSGTSYHISGTVTVHGQEPVPVDSWGTPGESAAPQLAAALGIFDAFNRLYTNGNRQEPMEGVRLRVETIPADQRVELESVRLVSANIVHPGDRVMVEATLRPWRQEARNVRISVAVPARLGTGNLRLLVSGAAAIDRTLDGARVATRPQTVSATSARLRGMHGADQVYVSLLMPESQASLDGGILDSLPLSMANTLEADRGGQDVGLHGESLVVAATAPAGGVLNGQQILTVHVVAGGGLH
jgi:hypothetical protein